MEHEGEGDVSDGGRRPVLSVVISTHRRPGQLREAIAAIAAQDLKAPIETVVVFDKEEPDLSLNTSDPMRPVRVLANHRTPGLPGSRNSGVEVATADVVGFCDDDDLWKPSKARLQLELMRETGAPAVGCGIEVVIDDRVVPRAVSSSPLRIEDLIRTRPPEAYMSTVLVNREAFWSVGPVDEAIPGGFAEDYEWWLRAVSAQPVPLVPDHLFQLRWGSGSYFRDKWRNMYDALGTLVDRYPGFASDRRGYSRIKAQMAFAAAGAGDRPSSFNCLMSAARQYPLEVRLPFAALALAGVPADRIMAWLNARGRGI